MQFNTKQKNYNDSYPTAIKESDKQTNSKLKTSIQQVPNRKQGSDSKRQFMMNSTKNDQLFQAFPQLAINRVDSSQHREKLKSQPPPSSTILNLYNSLIQKPTFKNNSNFINTSAQKLHGSSNLNSRQSYLLNQQQANKPTYKLNYATYNKDNSFAYNYIYGVNSQDGTQNDVPTYKKINNVMTIEKMDMQISPKMVSSVISRESSEKQLSSGRYKQRVYQSIIQKGKIQNKQQDEAYNLYALRHPNQSIRKSTIQISKAISQNVITQLQRNNDNQQKKIKKLQQQLEQFKSNLKKWDQIKHRYQLDLQSKSRQIFDIERVNKRLTEQVQGIRAYRTMDTVQQVIIVKLKQQIMQLNKKIISMQVDHYKNQKLILQKQKSTGGVLQVSQPQEIIKKLQQQLFINKKEGQLLGIQLQKQKQKSWGLQKQKEQYLTQKSIFKSNYQQQLNSAKKQIVSLRQELQKSTQNIKLKDTNVSYIIEEQRKILQNDFTKKLSKKQQQFGTQLAQKLRVKQQQYLKKLNNQMRIYQSKLIENGRNQKLIQIEQQQIIDNLIKQKQKNQANYNRIIAQLQNNLQKTYSQQQEAINSSHVQQLQNFKTIMNENQIYIRKIQIQKQNLNLVLRDRQIQIDRLKGNNIKILQDLDRQIKSKAIWKQQQSFLIQNTLKTKFEADHKMKQKQLQTKTANIANLQQNLKQIKIKLQKQHQQLASQVQNQLKQKEQRLVKDLEETKIKLSDEVKKAQLNLININRQLQSLSATKISVQSQIAYKLNQAKDIERRFLEIQQQIQSKTNQLIQLQSHKKLLIADNQKIKQREQKQQILNRQLQTKFKQLSTELFSFKIEYAKIQQRSKQLDIQLNKLTEINNILKTKNDSSQIFIAQLKKDFAILERDRDQFKAKFLEAEVFKAKADLIKKYEQLLPQYEIMKHKLQMKEQQISHRQATFIKARKQVQTMESRAAALIKQMKILTTKVTDTQQKFSLLISRAEADQHKYQQLYEKMVNDANIYMAFIKKLQEDNQLIAQKYWKIRKLVKKQKINDDNDLLQKHDYGAFNKYLSQEILNQFKKIIIPAFEAKIMQKISACESSIINKYKKLSVVKALVAQVKRRRQTQKIQLNAK